MHTYKRDLIVLHIIQVKCISQYIRYMFSIFFVSMDGLHLVFRMSSLLLIMAWYYVLCTYTMFISYIEF